MQDYAKWRFWLFWRFLVATFGYVIRMKLVAPIFHTEFDSLQVSQMRFFEIPPSGDFGYFCGYFCWNLLDINFKGIFTLSKVLIHNQTVK